MSDTTPPGLLAGGARLWASLLAQDTLLTEDNNPAREVALEACRTKDRCDRLDDICRTEDPMLTTDKGLPVAHPAWVEARQQANVLKQLVAALRLPDEATGKRPQVRGPRGAQRPSGIGSARARLSAVPGA